MSTNEIAKIAGVSIGSVYQYFANKREVFHGAIEARAMRDVHVLTEFIDVDEREELEVEGIVRNGVKRLIELHKQHLDVHRVLLRAVPELGSPGLVRRAAELGRKRLSGLLVARRHQIRLLDPDLAAFILGHAVEAVVHAVILERPELLDDPRLGDELVELSLRYLSP